MKFILITLYILLFTFSSLFAQEKITLQLKWFHQFQFAGYYAAKEKGFYADLGLDVEIKERDININNIEQVINNEAQYGISDSILILYKVKKQPVVVISPIFQHSSNILMSLKETGIDSPYDLNNKNITFYSNDTDGFSILAMFKKLKVKPNLIRKIEINDYKKLLNRDVDLIPGYYGGEPFLFKERNIDLNIIDPTNYGFDLYGDILFTNEEEAKKHPQRVKKFQEASLKGWEYALNNKEEIIQLIYEKYSKDKSIKHLRYEAEVIERLISRETTPLGTLDNGRVQYIYNLYKNYGLVNNKLDIKKLIFKDYIHNTFNIELTKEEQQYLKNHPVLRVQSSDSFPPYNFIQDNQNKGFAVDYLNLVSKILGVNFEFVDGKTWKEYLDMIQKDEIDILPQVAINEDRKKYIAYTDFKHIDYQVSIGFRSGEGINSFQDLSNKTIAVVDKSFLHILLKNNYPNQKLYLTTNNKEAIDAVANGSADAVIDNLATIDYYKNKNWLSNIETRTIDKTTNLPARTALYMGVSKNNLILKSILEKVNKALPYNELTDLQKKWLNLKTKIKWTNEEVNYLDKKKELTLCIDPNWMPIEKIQNNKHIGITSEYITLFEKELSIPIKLKQTTSWLDSIKYAEEKKCDLVSLMVDTKYRREHLNFTQSFMEMPLVIATKQNKPFINDISNVLSEKLGVVKGYAYIDILKKQYPNIKIVEVENTFDGLSKVNKDEIYGFIGILPVVGYGIQQNFLSIIKIAGKLNEQIKFSMATRNDEPLLNDILDKLILNIPTTKKQEILNKYLSIKYEKNVDYKNIIYLAVFFIIIILIISIKNRAIKKINKQLNEYIKLIDENVITSSTDLKGVITHVSKAFCNISGYSKKELIGQKHNIIRHPDMQHKFFKDIWKSIISKNIWKGEIKNKNKKGEAYWVNERISAVFNDNKKVISYTSISHDISDKKIIEEISITDELTGLYNKRYFNEVFERELFRAKRDNHTFAFIILDVDNFKLYNDNYGHQKGDDVLKAVGEELKNICKRSSDIPYRIGGEEFAISFIPDTREEAIKFSELINKSIEALKIEHKYNKANSNYITVSIGLYAQTGDKLITNTKDIYNFADAAMYKAKEMGRNRTVLYE